MRSFLTTVSVIAGAFLTSVWAVYPDGFPMQIPASSAYSSYGSGYSSAAVGAEAYCGLVKHILLLIFTCGIWLLIWIYRVTDYTNNVEGEEYRNPTNKLLLCIFVPFYQIYWVYKTAQRIDKMAAAKGIPSDLSTLCLILEFFVSIVPPVLMQDKLNEIVMASADSRPRVNPVEPRVNPVEPRVNPVEPRVNPVEPRVNPVRTRADIVEELKQYKELLDMGILTQEEFDAMKKQLLGL